MGFLIKDMGKGNRRPLISHMEVWGAQGTSKPSGYFAKCLLSKAGKDPWYLDSTSCYGNTSDEQKKKPPKNTPKNPKEVEEKFESFLKFFFREEKKTTLFI